MVAPCAAAATFRPAAGGGWPVASLFPKASTSVRRPQPSFAHRTRTRMRVVVSGAKAIERHTRLLLTITPPGTVCQAEPVQYWTVKSLTPHWDQVMVGVGSLGAFQASWTVKTATSSMVLLPAKVISTESGYTPPVASCQTPPPPYAVPLRSPSMTADAG